MNLMIFAQYYDQHMMDNQDWGWGFVMMLLFFIVIAAIVVFIIRFVKNNSDTQHGNTEPLDIAKSRYAKGEITKAQFDEIKKDLKT